MAKFYAKFDGDGNPVAFYNTNDHGVRGKKGCIIPAGVVEITQDDWLAFVNSPGRFAWGKSGRVEIPAQVQTAERAKTNKLSDLDKFMLKQCQVIDWRMICDFVKDNPSEVVPFNEMVTERVRHCQATHDMHLEAINALTTTQEVVRYDFTTGW